MLTCVQCREKIVVVAYNGPNRVDVAALPSTYGRLSTPHTPSQVAYYLFYQAQRAQSVCALSAAVAMHRAALEQLLREQGYTRGCSPRRSTTSWRTTIRRGGSVTSTLASRT